VDRFAQPNLTLDNYETVLTGGDVLPGGITPYFFQFTGSCDTCNHFPDNFGGDGGLRFELDAGAGRSHHSACDRSLQVVPIQMALIPMLEMLNTGWSIGPIPIVPLLWIPRLVDLCSPETLSVFG